MYSNSKYLFLMMGVSFFLFLFPVKLVYPVTIGSEFPIATTEVREQSISFAFDGTNYLVGIQGDASLHYNITAQLVSQTGSLVGSRISVGRTGGIPLVAFDGTNYLMVWEDDANHPNDDIYGRFISTTGTLVGPAFPISTMTGPQRPYGIAFDGNHYLVVWEDFRNDINHNEQCDSGEGTCADIYAQFIKPSGSLEGSEIPISMEVENQRVPTIAFDGTTYLMAWENRQSGINELWDIYGRFITKAGLLSAPFMINETSSPSYNPLSMAFDGTNYLVVWNKDFPDYTMWDIYGRIVTASGTFPGSEFPVSTAIRNQIYPFAAFNGTDYLVAWTDARNDANNDWRCEPGEGTCLDIYGQIVTHSGTLDGSEFFIIDADENQLGSALAFDGTNFMVVYNTGGIYFDDESNWDVYGVFASIAEICECDLNHDGSCNIMDWPYFIEDWGRTDCIGPSVSCECDLNGDGACNILDWPYFIEDWGRSNCPIP